jgi:glycosyltransferase involved in cell wall biosynthesis
MARLLMQALRAAGHEVFLASRLRTREPLGDRAAQERLRLLARQEIAMLSARLLEDPPDLWFTYHVYYKAPDLIGPAVCDVLDIPYVVAEASHADKRMSGPHAAFAAEARSAIARADAVLSLTARDRAKLAEIVPPERLHALKPFVRGRPRPLRRSAGREVRLLAVGMMRRGDKLHSYALLAQALRHLRGRWTLTIAGGGEREAAVRRAFLPFRGRVRFAGVVPQPMLNRMFACHDLLLWPAVNEAYGMALLEASANGLPVIAGDEGGVAEVVRQGSNGLLVPRRDPLAMARAASRLMEDRRLLRRLQAGSWRQVGQVHMLRDAARTLDGALRRLC